MQRKLEASWLGLGYDDLLAIIASALGVVAAVVLIFLYQEKGVFPPYALGSQR